jgi:hypothetical protein
MDYLLEVGDIVQHKASGKCAVVVEIGMTYPTRWERLKSRNQLYPYRNGEVLVSADLAYGDETWQYAAALKKIDKVNE